MKIVQNKIFFIACDLFFSIFYDINFKFRILIVACSTYCLSISFLLIFTLSSCTSINFWEQKQSCSFKFCLNESNTIVYCIQCWVLLDNITDATAKSLSFSLSPSFSAYRPRRTPCKYYDSRRRWLVGKKTNSPWFDALIVSENERLKMDNLDPHVNNSCKNDATRFIP